MANVNKFLRLNAQTDANQKQYKEDQFRQRIQKKFAPKDYRQRFREQYNVVRAITYPLQILMIATGLTGLTLLVGNMIGYELSLSTLSKPIALFAVLISVALLIGLEVAKRIFSEKSFELWFEQEKIVQFAGVALLMGISIGLSFYGSVHIVKATGGGNIDLVNIEAIHDHYKPLIAQSMGNLDGFKNRKGEFYHKYSDQVDAEQALLTTLRTEYQSKLNSAETNNAGLTASTLSALNQKAFTIGYVSIICELLFLICIGWKEKYEFNCSLDFETATPTPTGFKDFTAVDSNRPTKSFSLNQTTDRTIVQGFRRSPVTIEAQQLQTDTKIDTNTKKVKTDIAAIKRRISTANSRIHPKTQGNKYGWVTEQTRDNRLEKLREDIEKLKEHGIETIVNFKEFQPVQYS